MAKYIYLYSSVYSDAIKGVNEQLDSIEDSEDITFRINSGGGEVNAGFSLISRMSEREGNNNAIVDGQAKSMAAYWLPFFDHVVANDTSELMFHKAAYPSWYEPTESEQESLDGTNDMFEQKMRAKVEGKPGSEKFLKKLFEKGKRNNVEITAYEAKKLGIINEVRKLNPTAYAGMQIVAMFEEESNTNTLNQDNNTNTKKTGMELTNADLEKARKEGYDAGYKKGATAEHENNSAWAEYADIAPEKVKEAIENRTPFNTKAMAEMGRLIMANDRLNAHANDNADGIDTPPVSGKTAEQIEEEKMNKEVENLLND